MIKIRKLPRRIIETEDYKRFGNALRPNKKWSTCGKTSGNVSGKPRYYQGNKPPLEEQPK